MLTTVSKFTSPTEFGNNYPRMNLIFRENYRYLNNGIFQGWSNESNRPKEITLHDAKFIKNIIHRSYCKIKKITETRVIFYDKSISTTGRKQTTHWESIKSVLQKLQSNEYYAI